MTSLARHPLGRSLRWRDGLIVSALDRDADHAIVDVTDFALFGEEDSLVPLYVTSTLATASEATVTDLVLAITSALNATSDLVGFDLPNLIDTIAITGVPFSYRTTYPDAADSVAFGDTLDWAWSLLLTSSVQLAPEALGNRYLLGAMADTLAAIGAADGRLTAYQALTTALALEALLLNGWRADSVDTVGFNEAMANTVRLYAPLADAAALGGVTEPTVRLVVIGADTLALGDDVGGFLTMGADASDAVMGYVTARLGDLEFSGWVLNTVTKAPSEYRNFPYESLETMCGSTYAAGEGGIVELVGDDDAGDPIAAFVRTMVSDFGNDKLKRYPDVYFGKLGDGRLVLKTVTIGRDGRKVEDWYVSEPMASGGVGPRKGRFKVGRGLDSVWWQFVIHNKAGGALDLTGLVLHPLILDKRT